MNTLLNSTGTTPATRTTGNSLRGNTGFCLNGAGNFVGMSRACGMGKATISACGTANSLTVRGTALFRVTSCTCGTVNSFSAFALGTSKGPFCIAGTGNGTLDNGIASITAIAGVFAMRNGKLSFAGLGILGLTNRFRIGSATIAACSMDTTKATTAT